MPQFYKVFAHGNGKEIPVSRAEVETVLDKLKYNTPEWRERRIEGMSSIPLLKGAWFYHREQWETEKSQENPNHEL